MNHTDSTSLVRAVLGELSAEEQRAHEARLAADPAYRVAHDELLGITGELRALDHPVLPVGLDLRVLAVLRTRSRLQVQPAHFWRLAAPGLLAASILVTLAMRSASPVVPTATVTLASWYPISSDPTVVP